MDPYLLKSTMFSNSGHAHNVVDMKYSVLSAVKMVVKVKDGKELPKLVDILKKPSKSEPLVLRNGEVNSEHILVSCGELHMEICLRDFCDESAQCEFIVSDPAEPYRVCVSELSSGP